MISCVKSVKIISKQSIVLNSLTQSSFDDNNHILGVDEDIFLMFLGIFYDQNDIDSGKEEQKSENNFDWKIKLKSCFGWCWEKNKASTIQAVSVQTIKYFVNGVNKNLYNYWFQKQS